MSNKGGSSAQHCLVGNVRPKSKAWKRKNKSKARAKNGDKKAAFNKLTAGV